MKTLVLILFLPALALAQGTFHAPSDVIRRSAQETTGALNLYVDPTGNDGNACTATSTSACLTIQGALNKVPKLIRHVVTITVAAGNFTGAKIEGFKIGSAATTAGASLTLQGTLSTATLGAGAATGTATGGTRGSEVATPATHATVVNSAEVWTINALRGYFLSLTGGPGSGDLKAIESNTGTTIVAAGRLSAIPTTSTTYAILEAKTVINAAATRNADLVLTSGAVAGFLLQNNDFPPGTLLIQKLKITSTGSYGIYMQTPTNLMSRYNNFSPGGTTAGMTVIPGGSLDVLSCTWPAIVTSTYVGAAYQVSRVVALSVGGSEASISSSVFVGSGGNNGYMTQMASGALYATMNYGTAMQRGLWLGSNVTAYSTGNYFSTVALHCISDSLNTYPSGIVLTVNGDSYNSCARAIYGTGRITIVFTSVASTGSSNTVGLYLENGARVISDSAGYAFTSTTDITIKTLGSDTTSTAAAFRALTPKVLLDANTLTGITEL